MQQNRVPEEQNFRMSSSFKCIPTDAGIIFRQESINPASINRYFRTSVVYNTIQQNVVLGHCNRQECVPSPLLPQYPSDVHYQMQSPYCTQHPLQKTPEINSVMQSGQFWREPVYYQRQYPSGMGSLGPQVTLDTVNRAALQTVNVAPLFALPNHHLPQLIQSLPGKSEHNLTKHKLRRHAIPIIDPDTRQDVLNRSDDYKNASLVASATTSPSTLDKDLSLDLKVNATSKLETQTRKLRPNAIEIVDPGTQKNSAQYSYVSKWKKLLKKYEFRPQTIPIMDLLTTEEFLNDSEVHTNLPHNTSEDSTAITEINIKTPLTQQKLVDSTNNNEEPQEHNENLSSAKFDVPDAKLVDASKVQASVVQHIEVTDPQTAGSAEENFKGKPQENIVQATDAFTATGLNLTCVDEAEPQNLFNHQPPQDPQLKEQPQESNISSKLSLPMPNVNDSDSEEQNNYSGETSVIELQKSVNDGPLEKHEQLMSSHQKLVDSSDNDKAKDQDHKEKLSPTGSETAACVSSEKVETENDHISKTAAIAADNSKPVDKKLDKKQLKNVKGCNKSQKAASRQKNKSKGNTVKPSTDVNVGDVAENEEADKLQVENNKAVDNDPLMLPSNELQKSAASKDNVVAPQKPSSSRKADVAACEAANVAKDNSNEVRDEKRYSFAELLQLRATKASLLKPARNIYLKLSQLRITPTAAFKTNANDFIFTRGTGNATQPNRMCEKPIIHLNLALDQDVKLNEAGNAWRPRMMTIPAEEENDPEERAQREKEQLVRRVRGILNKLTPEKFQPLVEEVIKLKIDTKEKMEEVMVLVFEKAVDEPNFSVSYASLCQRLISEIKAQEERVADRTTSNLATFHKSLLTKAEQEFTENVRLNKLKQKKLQPIIEQLSKCTDADERLELKCLLEEEDRKIRRRSAGTVRFIGELFKLSMLTGRIIHSCIDVLLRDPINEDMLECLCKLLTTVGQKFEQTNIPKTDKKFCLDKVIKRMQNIAAKNSKFKVSSRIRFMLQDVIDLRKTNWQSKRTETPKTMEQIENEVKTEKLIASMRAPERSYFIYGRHIQSSETAN